MIDKMMNCTAFVGETRKDTKWRRLKKERNSPKYGYYMLHIITTPAVRDHLSDREVSTVLFLPANIRSMAGELPRASQYLKTVNNL